MLARPKRRDVIHVFGLIDAAELGVQALGLSSRIREQFATDFQVCYPNLFVPYFLKTGQKSFRTSFTGI